MPVRLRVRVTARASADAITGFDEDGVLHVRVSAPPAGGQANLAVVKLLARALGLPSREVALVAGATARLKVFDLPLTEGELHALLPARRP
ncbi:MAG: DUF167 domain-containing protein [Dehalococcoidia bacterium]